MRVIASQKLPRDSGETIFAARHQSVSQGPLGMSYKKPRHLFSELLFLYVSVFSNSETRKGCGCFWDHFEGSQVKILENPGNDSGKVFPNREIRSALLYAITKFVANLAAMVPAKHGIEANCNRKFTRKLWKNRIVHVADVHFRIVSSLFLFCHSKISVRCTFCNSKDPLNVH